jgi:hypothetical protein
MKNPHQLKLARLMLASSRLKTLKQEPMTRALRKPVLLKSTSLKSESSKIEPVKSASLKVVPERLASVTMVPLKSFTVKLISERYFPQVGPYKV